MNRVKHYSINKLLTIIVVLFMLALSGTVFAENRWALTESGVKLSDSSATEGNFATWSGAKDADDYADGIGVLQWYINGKTAVRFEGTMIHGRRNGQGTLTWPNGDCYKGDFVDDRLTGRGIYTAATGNRYEGGFVDGKASGRGIIIWSSGDRYEGDWIDNKRTGKGVLTWANGDRYEGDFVDDKAHGKGVFIWANGDRYEGDFVNDKQSGKGILTAANGDRYQGDFVDDRRMGKGILTLANGDRYEGDFANGKGTGKGIFTWVNGDRYEGDFVNDKAHGKGIFTWVNGDRYEGGFVNGKLEGYGTFYRHEGMTKKGYWANGEYVGQTAPAASVAQSTAPAATRQYIENKVVNKIYIKGNTISSRAAILAALPALQEGRTIDTRELSGEILLANENAFRKIAVNFQPNGDRLDAYVVVKEISPIKSMVSVDNTGDTFTGWLRTRFSYMNGNVNGSGQTALLSYATAPDHTADVKQLGLFYNLPLPQTRDNVYLIASYSDVNSGRILNQDFYSVDATGKGSSVGLHYVHNLSRTPQEKTGLDFGLDARQYRNGTILTFIGIPLSTGVDIDSMPLSISYQGNNNRGADITSYSLSYIHNIPGGGKNSTAQYEQYRYGTSASYKLWRGSFNYQHLYKDGWLTNIALSGQYTNERLIYPEQFGLGGIWSIRGMNERDVAGDRGVQARFELYTPEVTKGQRFLLFTDAGYFDNIHPITGDLIKDSAVSCGLGWRYNNATGFSVVADYGYMLNGTVNTPAHSSKFHFTVSEVF
jgi:hemolysin activation/secretion protein